jgi:hypothetical protein
MFPLIAGIGALSCLTSLLQSSTSNVQSAAGGSALPTLDQMLSDTAQDVGASQSGTAGAGITGTPSVLDSGTLNTLLSLQGQASDDGTISQSGFEKVLGTAGVDTSRADALYNKLVGMQSQLQSQAGQELSTFL